MPNFFWAYWIERLAASKGNWGYAPAQIRDLTHAHPDVDSIYAAEERGLPEDNITDARDSQSGRRAC
jgi:hypothetical protein